MRCSKCGVCCTKTEMLLSEEDVERLVKAGFVREFFVREVDDGYLQLRNRRGFCVFYDSKKHHCRVYEDRPAGCRVYPVILEDKSGVILDDICPDRKTVSVEEKAVKAEEVVKLLNRIDEEAAKRRP